ncbi:DHBP synthase RibB-like alpha/beta domain-containing protein [Aspergillus floccosus]
MTSPPKIIPGPGEVPNTQADALRVFDVLRSGGIAIVPTEVGYGLMASSVEAIEKAFAAKRRRPGHAQGLIGSYELHRELHLLDEDKFAMTKVLIGDLDMGLGIVAPYDSNHPLIRKLSPETLTSITKNGTLAMFVGGSSLTREICRLNYEAGQIMVGSSANVTGTGQKFRVEDIEDEIKEVADLIVDYGLQRYHIYGRASIVMDFGQMKILRMGSAYELLRERMRKFWGLELPEDPEFGNH